MESINCGSETSLTFPFMEDLLARFLQYDSVTIVSSRGYGDAIAVWHQALGGCQTPSLFGAN